MSASRSMPPASASFISVGYRWMLLPDWVHVFWYRNDSGIGIFVHFRDLTHWMDTSQFDIPAFKKGVHLARPYCWQWKRTHPVRSYVQRNLLHFLQQQKNGTSFSYRTFRWLSKWIVARTGLCVSDSRPALPPPPFPTVPAPQRTRVFSCTCRTSPVFSLVLCSQMAFIICWFVPHCTTAL